MRLTAADVEYQKERILRSALEVFSTKGYAATKMEDIAKAAQTSRSPLYYHYSNKQVLFLAAVEDNCNKILESEERVYESDSNVFEKIRRALFSGAYYSVTMERLRSEMYLNNPSLFDARKKYEECRERLFEIKVLAFNLAKEKGELKADCKIQNIIDMMFFFHRGLIGEMVMRCRGGEVANIKEDHIVSMINEFVAMLQLRYGAPGTFQEAE